MKDKQILSLLKSITPRQRTKIIQELSELSSIPKYSTIRSELVQDKLKCVHCDSEHIVKFGNYSGRKRYKCKTCLTTFTDLTGTSISCVKKKDLWNDFLTLMLENKSIREISKELKVSPTTIFSWRHKVLTSLNEIFKKKFSGIVETDDIFLPFNQKGRKNDIIEVVRKRGVSDNQVSVMVVMDREGSLEMKKTKRGRITVNDLERVISMERFHKENNIICSDSHPTLIKFFRDKELKHETINVSGGEHVKDRIYHVQKVNNLTGDFKKWLSNNYLSVSTKYLQNYLNLYSVIHVLKFKRNKVDNLLRYSLMNDETFEMNRKMEELYQQFLSR